MNDSAIDPQIRTQRGQVEAMAGFGVPEADIAKVLELEPVRLRELFGKELDGGRTRANAKVAENLFRKAIGDGRESVTAAIFWLKTRAGWKETAVHQLNGSAEEPLQVIITKFDSGVL
jgi:hypothetical protein